MATRCFPVVRGKRARFTRLDNCGNPLAAGTPEAVVVTKGFIRVALTAEIETGDEHTVKNADGDLCVSDMSRHQFKRSNVEVEFCEVNPSILAIASNAVLETDWNDDVVGVRQPEGASLDSFGLEVWAGVPGTDCLPGEPITYGYLLLPFVIGGPLGDITIENGAATFTVASFTRGAGGWGVGPYDVVPTDASHTPGPLAVPMSNVEHFLLRTTTVAPPDPECDALPMPGEEGEGEGE